VPGGRPDTVAENETPVTQVVPLPVIGWLTPLTVTTTLVGARFSVSL
jgi:hypothetical protein